MSTVKENDLRELKDLIKEQNAKIEKLDEKLDKFRENVNQQFLQVFSVTNYQLSVNSRGQRPLTPTTFR
jgi:predicted RNase H-like nuclease (RuvC/YqgF family)